jgi:hypothetical protein
MATTYTYVSQLDALVKRVESDRETLQKYEEIGTNYGTGNAVLKAAQPPPHLFAYFCLRPYGVFN